MNSIENILQEIIVARLMLPVTPADLSVDSSLFAPQSAGGMELDSLASLEIMAAISDRFQMPLDDMVPTDFQTIASLADYLRRRGVKDE